MRLSSLVIVHIAIALGLIPHADTAASDEASPVPTFQVLKPTKARSFIPRSLAATKGRRLAASGSLVGENGRDDAVVVWDVGRNEELLHVSLGVDGGGCVALSSDGALLAVARGGPDLFLKDKDYHIQIWSIDDAKRLAVLKGAEHVSSLSFTADGKKLISGGCDGTVRLWDVKDSKEQGVLYKTRSPLVGNDVVCEIRTIAISPRNETLIIAEDFATVTTYNFAEKRAKPLFQRRSSNGGLNAKQLFFSADGSRLLTRESGDLLRIWDLEMMEELYRIEEVRHATLSPDGRRLATLEGDNIKLRNALSGRMAHELEVAIPVTDRLGRQRIYRRQNGPCVFIDNNTLATSCLPGIVIWDLEGKPKAKPPVDD